VTRRLGLAGGLLLPPLILRLAQAEGGAAAGVVAVASAAAGLLALRPLLSGLTRGAIADGALLLGLYATLLFKDVVVTRTAVAELAFLASATLLAAAWPHREAVRTASVLAFLVVVVVLARAFGASLASGLHPRLLGALFSSRNGLLFWSPVLWAGIVGLVLLARREPRTAGWLGAAGLAVLVDGTPAAPFVALPLLLPGLALALDAGMRLLRRRPALPLGVLGAALAVWNVLLMAQYRSRSLPADEPVSFVRVTSNGAALVSEWVGTPLAWPANWIFALRYDVAPAEYDLRAGRPLFLSRSQREAVVDAGDPRSDPAFFSSGWTSARPCEDALCRGVQGRARAFFPLDGPEPLTLVLRVRGRGALLVAVNGSGLGGVVLPEALGERRLRIPATRLREGQNELFFSAPESDDVWLDYFVLRREP
jgi:hypothetical protein